MIYGIFGYNGSGKTLTMTRELLNYDIVFVNYNYKGTDQQIVVFDPDTTRLFYKLMAFTKKVGSQRIMQEHIKIALAIDEAGITFPAREWKKMSSEEAYLFAQHRKLGGMDFFYTAQSAGMVDRTLRSVTALWGYPFHFFQFFWVKWYMGPSRKKENFMYPVFFIATKKLYDLYSTLEEVSSSKFYFSDPSEHIDVLQYLSEITKDAKNIQNQKLQKILQQGGEQNENNNNNTDVTDIVTINPDHSDHSFISEEK